MEDKIKRFIELSKEFTIDSREIYGKNNDSICFIDSSSFGVRQENNFVEPTRLDIFIKAEHKKIAKAGRYEEYLKLQTDLSNYYNALTKLK